MKQPLSLLFAAVAATACAPAVPAGEFRIVGKIENVPDGAVVRLYEPQGQMLRGIGVDTLAGGRFSFRDTVAFPKVVQISVTVGDYRGGTLAGLALGGRFGHCGAGGRRHVPCSGRTSNL